MRTKGSVQVFLAVFVCAVCVAAGFGAGRLFTQQHQAANRAHEALVEHGIWTIAVYNPGGQEVSSRTFHNDLVTGFSNGGDAVLADLLTRTYPMGPWTLVVEDNSTIPVLLFQLSSAADNPVQGPLTVSAPSPGHVQLAGQWTATSAVTIGKVVTDVSLCTTNNVAPANCVNFFGDFFFVFSSATLAPVNQVSLATGQIVQITVDISFS